MDLKKDQEQFEAWVQKRLGLDVQRCAPPEDAFYANPETNVAWQAWDARAELAARPDPGAAGDAEFLSLRLARLAKLLGYQMPRGSHEFIAGVAGTLLGRMASHVEREWAALAAQPAAEPIGYINPGDLEQMKQHGRGGLIWPQPVEGATQPLYAAAQPAQPVERDSYVQPVPEHCDRIVWRNNYYHLLPTAQPAQAHAPLHITVLVDWLAARYRAAGGAEGITDVSAWAEEVMRWTEEQHGIGGTAGATGAAAVSGAQDARG